MARLSRRSPWLALVAAVLALAACGGADGEREPGSPSATVSDYFDAVDHADGREICSHLAPRARREIASLQNRPCPEAMGREARRLPESLNAYEILGEEVDGRTATVRVSGLGSEEEITLRRLDEAWRITDAPGLGL